MVNENLDVFLRKLRNTNQNLRELQSRWRRQIRESGILSLDINDVVDELRRRE